MRYVQMLDGSASDATASTLTRQHKLGYARWPAARARVNSLISDKGKKNTLDLVIKRSKELRARDYSSDYRHYFNKLLSKTDIYNNKDINEAIKLKNMVFNPREKEKYRFKEYLSIYKKLKRKIIIKMSDKTIPIDINIKPAHKRSDSKRHQILKANVEKIIQNDKKMTCTYARAQPRNHARI